MASPCVDLGFCEKTDAWRLQSHFFPSKVGGKPAWLALKPLPKPDDLKCSICGDPCVFLLQIYSPVDGRDHCFHRILFVFICKKPSCCQRNSSSNFVVVRSQLPKVNEFYGTQPPDEECSDWKPNAERFSSLCFVCGCAAPYGCSKCHNVHYCSRAHQSWHWKHGHKQSCCKEDASAAVCTDSTFLFPEYELVTELEDFTEDEDAEKSESEKMKDYNEFMESTPSTSKSKNFDTETLEKMASSEKIEDKQFNKFKARIKIEPDQVLRHSREDGPLWVSNENIPSSADIPPCKCGAPRQFEFQILPQLLTYLKVDSLEASIDWGTLAVYTCSTSCGEGENYLREFLWKQDFSTTDSL